MDNTEFKNSSLYFYLRGVRTLLIIGLLPLSQPPQQKLVAPVGNAPTSPD